MPDLGYMLWEPCPTCEGDGELDASEEDEEPWSVVVRCWRCLGDGGWICDEPDEPGWGGGGG